MTKKTAESIREMKIHFCEHCFSEDHNEFLGNAFMSLTGKNDGFSSMQVEGIDTFCPLGYFWALGVLTHFGIKKYILENLSQFI